MTQTQTAIECPSEQRRRYRQVRTWAMAEGRAIDASQLILILCVKRDVEEPFDCWTADSLADFLWVDVVEWCRHRDLPQPPGLAETLWVYVSYLSESGLLTTTSDPLEQLQAALAAYGGLNRFGRPRVPARRRSPRPGHSLGRAAEAQVIPFPRRNTVGAPVGA